MSHVTSYEGMCSVQMHMLCASCTPGGCCILPRCSHLSGLSDKGHIRKVKGGAFN